MVAKEANSRHGPFHVSVALPQRPTLNEVLTLQKIVSWLPQLCEQVTQAIRAGMQSRILRTLLEISHHPINDLGGQYAPEVLRPGYSIFHG